MYASPNTLMKEENTNSDPMIGQTIGGHRIEAHLGTGATGTVYRATQLSLDRKVAIKILHPYVAMHDVVVTRFEREAKAAASILHPNLVQIYDFGRTESYHYYTMEIVDGSSLGDYLKAGRTFDEVSCRQIARQALQALDAAHSAGIVHRDVKPDNMILDPKGSIKISDLGLARIGAVEEEQSLTMTGDTLGTPYYMSPEQVQDSRLVDFRCDYYSLGASLYHLLVGSPPFDGATRFTVMQQHVQAPIPEATEAMPEVSKGFSDLLVWLMAKQPEERPDSAAEIYEALDAIEKNATPAVPEPKRIPLGGKKNAKGPGGSMPELADAFAELALASAEAKVSSDRPSIWRHLLILLEILLVGALGFGAYILYTKSQEEKSPTPVPAPAPISAPQGSFPTAPTPPAPVPQINIQLPSPVVAAPKAPSVDVRPVRPVEPTVPKTPDSPASDNSTTSSKETPPHPDEAPVAANAADAQLLPVLPDNLRERSEAFPRKQQLQKFMENQRPGAALAESRLGLAGKLANVFRKDAADRRVASEQKGLQRIDLFEMAPPVVRWDPPATNRQVGEIPIVQGQSLLITPDWSSLGADKQARVRAMAMGSSSRSFLIINATRTEGECRLIINANPLTPGASLPKRQISQLDVKPGVAQVLVLDVTDAFVYQIRQNVVEEFQITVEGPGRVGMHAGTDVLPGFAPRLELESNGKR